MLKMREKTMISDWLRKQSLSTTSTILSTICEYSPVSVKYVSPYVLISISFEETCADKVILYFRKKQFTCPSTHLNAIPLHLFAQRMKGIKPTHQIPYLFLFIQYIAQWRDCSSRCWEYHKVIVLARPAASCSLCWHSERIQSSLNIRLFASLRPPAICSYRLVSYYIGCLISDPHTPAVTFRFLALTSMQVCTQFTCRGVRSELHSFQSFATHWCSWLIGRWWLIGDIQWLFLSCYWTGAEGLKALFNYFWWPPGTPEGEQTFGSASTGQQWLILALVLTHVPESPLMSD